MKRKNKPSGQLAKKNWEIARLKAAVVKLNNSVGHLEKQLAEEQKRNVR